MEKYPVGIIFGFLIGFMIIHPFSMLYEGMFFPIVKINYKSIVYAFSPQHLPMALFFGFFGLSLGAINVYYLKTIEKSKKRIKILEGLLPICSYCKRIRDDSSTAPGEGKWEQVDMYIYQKTEQEFTHGICPECVEKAFPPRNGGDKETNS